MKDLRQLLLLVFAFALVACGTPPAEKPSADAQLANETDFQDVLQHPDWSKNAVIYEVNIRQHTPEGTFKAFEADLSRLHEMGVDILWLMPIHPIGEKNRKGSKGSYYSVKDYQAVNPEFGSMEDFKDLVNKAHSFGMKVIIDWVANHSAFDNVWTETHQEYYLLDSLGQLQPPLGTDWWDVAQLNYENEELHKAMASSMAFWLKEADIDGFRCDVADMVPVEFWEYARATLDKEKSVFMLAEAENPRHHDKSFDMSYSWELMHIMNELAKEEKTLDDLHNYMLKEDTNFTVNDYRMSFITNHDENSWNGTVFERYGDAHKTFAVLAATINGMPLVYSGQEAANDKRLKFFEKDTIDWKDYPLQDFYSMLYKINKENEALWNGHYGGDYQRLTVKSGQRVFAFKRQKNSSTVVTVLNFDSIPASYSISDELGMELQSALNQELLNDQGKENLELDGYGYQIFVK